jgi:hypothetical protein
VAEHGPFSVVLAVGVVLRVLVLLAYRPALMLQVDAYAYLHQAYGAGPSGFRPALYPLLLRALLGFGSLAAIPIFQHLLGLGIAVGAYALARRLGAGPYLAAAGAVPLLLDGYQLIIEQYVLTETMFEALVGAAVAALLWPHRAAPLATATAGILLALAGLTRFVGLALILPALVYAGVTRLGWLRAAALAGAFFATLGLYAQWSRSAGDGSEVPGRAGFFLLGRVASFVACDGVEIPPRERPLCALRPPRPEEPRGFFALDLPPGIEARRDANALFLAFSKRMIAAHPASYAAAVGRDFARFFSAQPPLAQEPNVRRWRFPGSLEDADPHPIVRRYSGAAPPRLGVREPFSVARSLAGALRTYQTFFYTHGPLLALLALLSLAGAAAGRSPPSRPQARAACLLLGLGGLSLLLAPVLVTVHHFRYFLPSLLLLGPGGALGAALLGARFRERRT